MEMDHDKTATSTRVLDTGAAQKADGGSGSGRPDDQRLHSGGGSGKSEPLTELYRHYDAAGRLLYVGVSWSAVARYGGGHRVTASWAHEAVKMTIERFPTRQEALEAEATAIRSEKPLHNGTNAKPRRVRMAPAKAVEVYGPPQPRKRTPRWVVGFGEDLPPPIKAAVTRIIPDTPEGSVNLVRATRPGDIVVATRRIGREHRARMPGVTFMRPKPTPSPPSGADRLGAVKDIMGTEVSRHVLYHRVGKPGAPK